MKVFAKKDGYLYFIDTLSIGMAVVNLGGGRLRKEDNLDPTVGIFFHKKIGNKVYKGEPIIEYFCSLSI